MTSYHLRGVASSLISGQALVNLDLEPRVRRKCVKLLYKTCSGHRILPKSLRFKPPGNAKRDAQSRDGFTNVSKREYGGRRLEVKVLRAPLLMAQGVIKVSSFWRAATPFGSAERLLQKFCTEAILWNTLKHPNVLSLVGETMTESPLTMMSEWMPHGNIREFATAQQNTNRLELVSALFKLLISSIDHGRASDSWQMLRGV